MRKKENQPRNLRSFPSENVASLWLLNNMLKILLSRAKFPSNLQRIVTSFIFPTKDSGQMLFSDCFKISIKCIEEILLSFSRTYTHADIHPQNEKFNNKGMSETLYLEMWLYY